MNDKKTNEEEDKANEFKGLRFECTIDSNTNVDKASL